MHLGVTSIQRVKQKPKVFGPCFMILSSFAIISLRKGETRLLYFDFILAAMWMSVLYLFLTVPWISLSYFLVIITCFLLFLNFVCSLLDLQIKSLN